MSRVAARVRGGAGAGGWLAGLVYYAVAGLAGPLFVALVYYLPSAASWGADDRRVAGLVLAYGMALVGGGPASLVYAFALRRIAGGPPARHVLWWLAAGAALGLAVPWLFARAGYLVERTYFTAEWQWLKPLLVFPFFGSMMYETQPAWVRLLVAVAIALALQQTFSRIHGTREPEPRTGTLNPAP